LRPHEDRKSGWLSVMHVIPRACARQEPLACWTGKPRIDRQVADDAVRTDEDEARL
jgi:hypothetical protein